MTSTRARRPAARYAIVVRRQACPTPHAADVDDLHRWAAEVAAMAGTHTLTQCTGCGLHPVWVPKPGVRRG